MKIFQEYDSPSDAEEAVQKLDGYVIDGSKIVVQFARGSRSRG
jgi:RNA recognition motif-containing protein